LGYIIFKELIKNGNKKVRGDITLVSFFDFEADQKYSYAHSILLGEDFHETKISLLESAIQSIETQLESVKQWLFFWDYRGEEENICDSVEEKCNVGGGGGGGGFTNYFKYLSGSDRKKAVCGYAVDKNMTAIIDLGYNCTVSYRTSSTGKVYSSCRCTLE